MIEDDLKQLIEGTAAETRRHIDVVAERLRGDIQLVAEAVGRTIARIDHLETRFDGLETRFDALDAKVDAINANLTRTSP
jgi:hypothetical protein